MTMALAIDAIHPQWAEFNESTINSFHTFQLMCAWNNCAWRMTNEKTKTICFNFKLFTFFFTCSGVHYTRSANSDSPRKSQKKNDISFRRGKKYMKNSHHIIFPSHKSATWQKAAFFFSYVEIMRMSERERGKLRCQIEIDEKLTERRARSRAPIRSHAMWLDNDCGQLTTISNSISSYSSLSLSSLSFNLSIGFVCFYAFEFGCFIT